MSEDTHTPGPLNYAVFSAQAPEDPECWAQIWEGNDETAIATVTSTDGRDVGPYARFFAAAPTLYHELRHLVRLLEPLERDGGLDVPGLATLNGARRALKMAEGKGGDDA